MARQLQDIAVSAPVDLEEFKIIKQRNILEYFSLPFFYSRQMSVFIIRSLIAKSLEIKYTYCLKQYIKKQGTYSFWLYSLFSTLFFCYMKMENFDELINNVECLYLVPI